MFLNISNHPTTKWEQTQIDAAMDMTLPLANIPFPNVPPEATTQDIEALVNDVCSQIDKVDRAPTHAMVMGEFTLTFALVKRLRETGVRCFAASTMRKVVEQPDGTKISVFRFVKFREYL